MPADRPDPFFDLEPQQADFPPERTDYPEQNGLDRGPTRPPFQGNAVNTPRPTWTLYDLQTARDLGLSQGEIRYLLIRHVFPELQFVGDYIREENNDEA